MPEEWIVRVEGKEYGPVGLEELRAWRQDGRLIRSNEVREAGSERWFRAGDLPEVFADDLAPASASAAAVRRKSFGEIIAQGWRIYRAGFGRFFLFGLLVSIPSFFLQIVAPFLEMPKAGAPVAPVAISAAVAFVMLMALVIGWPFSVGLTQLLSADLLAERAPSFGELFARAKPLWSRLFLLGLIVYGSYFLWTVVPMLVALSLANSPTLSALLFMLLLSVFTLYMVARLFINFLFWQQSGALGGGDAMEALRESKELARSGLERPRLQRPLYRGAIIASAWLLLIIALNIGIELPAMLWRLRGVTTVEQALPLVQSMASGSPLNLPSVLTTFLSCLVGAIFRGWLAATFVVLYLDTREAQPGRNAL